MSEPAAGVPVLVIAMGVSGCGKSTLAESLAGDFGFRLLEADDFHPPANKAHMASGQPLTDAMREPWIDRLCDELRQCRERSESCVLAYSGLRRIHRQRFRELDYPVLFLHLAGPRDEIHRRMQARSGHYMPASLLDSQYAALEPALDEPDIVEIDVTADINAVCRQAAMRVHGFLTAARAESPDTR